MEGILKNMEQLSSLSSDKMKTINVMLNRNDIPKEIKEEFRNMLSKFKVGIKSDNMDVVDMLKKKAELIAKKYKP